jgi:hypothetical protein
MAVLDSDTGALRFRLDFVDREAPVRGPVAVVAQDGSVPAGRLLATAAVEYLDRRDGERWPVVRLPVLFVAPEAVKALVEGLAALLQGIQPGFAWQSGADSAVGVQMGTPEGAAPGTLLVEIGMDLGVFLAEAARTPRRPGSELALFRFPATRAAAVAFADGLRSELERLLSR